ncbi:MAG: N-6 DNA methylase, partial [Eubacterium sp.]|nr:N-6 DNA methylase [Eubacterium sp.]
ALYGTTIFTPLHIEDTDILKSIIDKLDPLTLTDVDSDVKGDAFEYFLKESTSTKNDLGEYFTPRHIVKTMVRFIDPKIGEKIYDPFCGTGGFLIETFRYIERNIAGNDPELLKKLREKTVYGNEITDTARITKMNMILVGDGHSNIHKQDSLANPVYLNNIIRNEKGEICRDDANNVELSEDNYIAYDAVITNMPYSQKTNYGGLYDIPSTNGDSICVQHCMKAISSLSQNGRMALVVPEGFLFRKDLAKMREYMLERCELQSVISLPQGVFLPYTGVKTNIVYAKKVNQKIPSKNKRKDFWYFDVKSDGYTLDNHRRKLETPSDLSKFEEYRKLDADQAEEMMQVGFEAIPLDRVRDNSFVLVGSRYRKLRTQDASYPLIYLGDKRYFSILSGGTPSSSNPRYWNGDVNWITLADLPADNFITPIFSSERTITAEGLNNSSAKLLPINTVVVSSRATIGRIGITKTELATNQGFKNIVINDHSVILPEYLAYMLTAKKDEMLHMASGGTFKEISKENFMTIQIPLCSLDNQKKFVEEIESYQRVINGARAIIDSYKPSIPQNIKGDYFALKDIAMFRPSKEEIKSLAADTKVSFVPMSDLNVFNIDFAVKEERTLSNVSTGFTFFRNNDILLAKITPCFENGKAGMARDLKNGIGFGSTEYIVIRAKTDLVFPEWIFYHINSSDFLSKGKAFMTGTAGQQRIDLNYVKDFSIPLPSLEVQAKILSDIKSEQSLIEPSKKLIDVFTLKIKNIINGLWGE